MNQTIAAETAWRWIAQEYERPGRAAELLRAQDEEGLDVVLHLFAQYAREELGIALDAAALAEADALLREWREEVIVPLRTIRRRLKEKPAPGAGSGDGTLRPLVQQAELRAERVALEALCEWLTKR